MMRNKALQLAALTLVVLLAASAPAMASPTLMTLQPADFASFDIAGQATLMLTLPYNYNNTFTGTMSSQVFSLTDGNYLYLYQAVNTGPSVLEVMAISPFVAFTASGYLTANAPAGFLTSGTVPLGATNDPTIPNISYNYPAFMGAHVPAGGNTIVAWLVSPHAPTMGEAYIIDSGVAVVPTYVAVPEPATMGLLGIGITLLAVNRKRRKSL